MTFTPDGGEVRIRMRRDGAGAEWVIEDTGIGVPAAARERLFGKFFRADSARRLSAEGTGLGLFLVQLIVERHGGRVRCEPEEGRGSTFTVSLPGGDGA